MPIWNRSGLEPPIVSKHLLTSGSGESEPSRAGDREGGQPGPQVSEHLLTRDPEARRSRTEPATPIPKT